MTNSLTRLIYGPPPPPDAQAADRLRYIRRIVLRHTAVMVPVFAVVFVVLRAYWGFAAVGSVLLIASYVVIRLNSDIRRATPGSDSRDPFGR